MDRQDIIPGRELSRRETLLAFAGTAAYLGLETTRARGQQSNSGIDWDNISREFMLDRSLTYLNTGSMCSTPKPVLAIRRALEQRLESNPVDEGYGPLLKQADTVAAKAADLICCDAKEVAVTRNTTEGVNFVAEGIGLQPGHRVLTSNNEHGGGLAAWKFWKKYHGIEVDVAEIASPPASEDQLVESFRKRLTPSTRVIFCSDVMFSNGVKVPIARLSALAHKHHCLMIVDGAQGLGGAPVNVKELGCDAYASSGHKFLLGPKGTGILYVSAQAKDRIKPMQLDDGYGYYTAIRGTNCLAEAVGLGAAIDWVEYIGRQAVYNRLKHLRNSLYDVLQQTPGIKIDSPPPGSSMASHLVCFSVADRDKYAKLDKQLTKDNIIVKHVHLNSIDYRLSVHVYNTEADVARFAASLKKGVG